MSSPAPRLDDRGFILEDLPVLRFVGGPLRQESTANDQPLRGTWSSNWGAKNGLRMRRITTYG